jgi:hypothetical protein
LASNACGKSFDIKAQIHFVRYEPGFDSYARRRLVEREHHLVLPRSFIESRFVVFGIIEQSCQRSVHELPDQLDRPKEIRLARIVKPVRIVT